MQNYLQSGVVYRKGDMI